MNFSTGFLNQNFVKTFAFTIKMQDVKKFLN